MINKQQIEKEAAAYTNENNGSGFEFQAFVVGARWAAERIQAENARLIDRNRHLEEDLKNAVFVLNRKIEEVFSLRAAIDKALSHEHFAQSHRTGCGLVLEILKNALKQ